MNAPFSLQQGHVLLLAEPDSFSASYIRRSLEMFGVPVLAPEGPLESAIASLDPAEWLSFSACIAVDMGKAMFETLSARQRDIPVVFIGQDPGELFAGPYSWLCPPFAAFQVVELLSDMVAAASRTMQAGLDLATARGGPASSAPLLAGDGQEAKGRAFGHPGIHPPSSSRERRDPAKPVPVIASRGAAWESRGG